MTYPQPQLPPTTDPLGETLHLLRLTGTLYCRTELGAPWGIDLPPIDGCMMLHIVTSGHCLLEIEGSETLALQTGSLALVPHGTAHILRSGPRTYAAPLFDIPVEQVSERYEFMRHGGDGEITQTICVVVRFDHVAAEHLIDLLPGVLQIDAWQDDQDDWLQSTLRFISREAKELRPGGETVITRLADILVIQMMRTWIDQTPTESHGWLAALRDGQIGRALTLMHREPARKWTVEELAQEVGMSRSAFSARFTQMVGDSALQYLTRWRLQLARMKLRETSAPISTLAREFGYQSEAAFSRAFKRVFGVSPGSVRENVQ